MKAADTLAIWCRRCRSVCEYGCDCPNGSPQWPLVTEGELQRFIYLAHPVTDYGGSARQREAISLLEQTGWQVENPDQPHHQRGYKKLGMDYFQTIVRTCDGLAFLRFPCGGIGAGVAKEIAVAICADMPVFEINEGHLEPLMSWPPTGIMSVEETRAEIDRARTQGGPNARPE